MVDWLFPQTFMGWSSKEAWIIFIIEWIIICFSTFKLIRYTETEEKKQKKNKQIKAKKKEDSVFWYIITFTTILVILFGAFHIIGNVKEDMALQANKFCRANGYDIGTFASKTCQENEILCYRYRDLDVDEYMEERKCLNWLEWAREQGVISETTR